MTARWRRIEPTDEVTIDGVLVVHDPGTMTLHALNSGAALLWHLLDRPTAPGALLGFVADATGRPAPELATEVEAGLDALVAAGLATDRPAVEPVDDTSPPVRPSIAHSAEPLRPGHTRLGPFALLDERATIDLPGEHPAHDVLDRLLHGLVDAAGDTGDRPDPAILRYGLEPVDDTSLVRVEVDGRLLCADGPLDAQLTYLLWHLNHAAVEGSRQPLLLHAGAVAGPSGTIALAGAPGAGKSTLTAALVRSGLGYVTDEALAIDPAGGVTAYAKPLSLDESSLGLLHLAPGEARAGHVSPDVVGPTSVVPPPLRAVILPDRTRALDPADLDRPLAASDALLALGACAFGLARRRQVGLDALAALSRRIPVLRLGTSDLDAATQALHRLLLR